MNSSPRLLVNIVTGIPLNEFGIEDRFVVEGEPELVEAFHSWWAENEMDAHVAKVATPETGFYLADDGDLSGGGGDSTFGNYIEWRNSMDREPALLLVA